MTDHQTSLFGNECAGQRISGELGLRAQPNRPLTKVQCTFNRLVGRIETLRAALARETRRLDEALAYWAQHLHPRQVRLTALRKDILRALAPFIENPRPLRKNEQKALQAMVADQLDAIGETEGSLVDADLRTLFERVHRVSFDHAERAGFEEARSIMEEAFGEFGIEIDFSDLRPRATGEGLAAKAAEMAERVRKKVEEEAGASTRSDRSKSKRQSAKEARLQQAEEIRKKSLATIYRQLAKVLHPDLEPDPERKQRKSALMQDLTTAYRNNDLHCLLRLELAWIEREEGDLERLTDEKLAVYNQVLKEQTDELQWELDELPYHPRYQPIITEGGPFGIFRVLDRTDGSAEAWRLDQMIAKMEAMLRRMRTDEALAEVRSAIQVFRATNQGRL
ncbi:MAG: J domain-containing protein [Nitrospirota bacterium]